MAYRTINSLVSVDEQMAVHRVLRDWHLAKRMLTHRCKQCDHDIIIKDISNNVVLDENGNELPVYTMVAECQCFEIVNDVDAELCFEARLILDYLAIIGMWNRNRSGVASKEAQ